MTRKDCELIARVIREHMPSATSTERARRQAFTEHMSAALYDDGRRHR